MSAAPIRSTLKVLSPEDESKFQSDYASYAKKVGISKDPDDPLHFYDNRAAWAAGQLTPDANGHLSSEFKLPGHPRMFMSPDEKSFSALPSPGWTNTKTGEVVPGGKRRKGGS